jgi:hypothetical protein
MHSDDSCWSNTLSESDAAREHPHRPHRTAVGFSLLSPSGETCCYGQHRLLSYPLRDSFVAASASVMIAARVAGGRLGLTRVRYAWSSAEPPRRSEWSMRDQSLSPLIPCGPIRGPRHAPTPGRGWTDMDHDSRCNRHRSIALRTPSDAGGHRRKVARDASHPRGHWFESSIAHHFHLR